MPIEISGDDMMAVNLPPEPEMRTKLEMLLGTLILNGDYDVALDFSDVDIVTAHSLIGLLRLRQLLADRGHRVVLCGLAANTKDIFAMTGLDKVFEFADDNSAVLSTA